jgi:uncharacterized membrane protein
MFGKTLLMVAGAALTLAAAAEPPKKPATVSFSEDIFPILQIRCGACHAPGGEGYETSGLDLRSYEGLIKGTKFGPIVVPGDDLTSNLVVLLDGRADKSLQMPHNKKKLTSCDRDLIRAWIREGAQKN